MRNTTRCIAILVLSWTSPTFAADTSACDPWAAKIVSIQGIVEARHASTDSWRAVTLNAVYCSGDSLRVAAHSRAALVLSNQTLLRLDQNSAITLTAIKADTPSLLDILTGWVHFISRVPRSLQVNTPYVNAAIEGTEFVVAVDKDQGSVTVFEGTVKASNPQGEVRITHNETAVAKAGAAPQKVLRATPRDAVQWALYYPPIFAPGDPLAPAADLLYHGRVEEARQALAPFANSADNGKAKALEAIIAVVNNDNTQALQLANEAVKLEPKSAATHIALSYAQQAQFNLDAALASAQQAVSAEPNNALAYARLAELQLSVGYLHKALDSAQHAVQLDPKQARAHTILGFAYLTQIHISEATQTFNTAIELDQADPLPRLGLGLAKIRKNGLIDGRREIEIAALLDPNNALIRSYLGKAYFEEKRPHIDADQFAMAKELDPKDPTPWFYDAIRKQTENRPVEALEDLQKSIELNDNRAVYRSRLQLDQDEAARSASLAQIYNGLGFNELSLLEGYNSLSSDPANSSAHRLLAESYLSLPRHEIARVSEYLQAQLLQPLSSTPVQPQFVETYLGIPQGQGTTNPSFSEYNSLFTRDGVNAQLNLIGGNHSTAGDELVLSGLSNKLAYSFGQFHYETDGFRKNNDLTHNIYNLFLQYQVADNLNIQAEYRDKRSESGDLRFQFDPAVFNENKRITTKTKTSRFGFNYQMDPSQNLIGSFYNTKNYSLDTDYIIDTIGNLRDDTSTESRGPASTYELQFLDHSNQITYILGIGHVESKFGSHYLEVYSTIPPDIPFSIPILDISETINKKYNNAYIYTYVRPHNHLLLTLGASYDSFRSDNYLQTKLNPKLGINFKINSQTELRIAAASTVKRALANNQTIEPTQVAGFNQFFNDNTGALTDRYGLAVDHVVNSSLNTGVELTWRHISNATINTDTGTAVFDDYKEQYHRAYLYWKINPYMSFSSELHDELFENPNTNITSTPNKIHTTRIPVGINFDFPTGFGAQLLASQVKQKYVGSSNVSQSDDFWVVDTNLRYRFSKRLGTINLGVSNIFNKNLNFYDLEYTGETRTPIFQPARTIYLKVNLVI